MVCLLLCEKVKTIRRFEPPFSAGQKTHTYTQKREKKGPKSRPSTTTAAENYQTSAPIGPGVCYLDEV